MTDNMVYLVTSGQYSDYGIRAVFRTKQEAERYIELYELGQGYDAAGIEEWEFSTISEKPAYRVYMLKNGDVRNVRKDEAAEESARVNHTSIQTHWRSNPEGILFTFMYAESEEHAIKIANERRTFLLASEQWHLGDYTDAIQSIIQERETA